MRRFFTVALLGPVVLALPAGALAAPQRGHATDDQSACDDAHAVIASAADERRVTDALLCLINRARDDKALGPLRANRCLARAADGHSQEMVRRRYFDHASPDGRRFDERIRATGYTDGARSWMVGENIAWGAAQNAEPAGILRAWMHSPPHRANLLSRSFDEVGIGAVHGAPVTLPHASASASGTYTVDFASRRGGRSRCG